MNLNKLPLANIARQPGRTAGLAVLVALLSFALFAGSLVVSSLANGLNSLEDRLGADILVAPSTAKSRANLDEVLLEGVPGSFYMNAALVGEVAEREGVAAVSPQYFLATVKAGCCSMPVQIIGFDPETDFSIQPWVARSYSSELAREDVLVGCNITGAPGTQIMFYGVDCTIVGKLDETGTALDNAVFATNETLQDLISGSREQGISVLAENDPGQVVSTVQAKVVDGYDADVVASDINRHVRGVKAVATKTMIASVSDSIAGAAGTIGALVAVLWILAIVVLVVAFGMIGRQRTKEFAVLRVLGASRKALVAVVLKEALVVGAAGALVGIAVGAIVVFAFNGALEDALGLPFLLPNAATIALFAALTLAIGIVAGPAASAFSAARLSKVDPGSTLRDE